MSRKKTNRWAAVLLAGTMGLCQQAAIPRGQAADRADEAQVIAALVYNFGKYVEWPEGRYPDASAPHGICVFRETPVFNELQKLARGKLIKQRPVLVRKISQPAEAAPCHVLYTGAADQSSVEAIHRALGKAPVLTVSDSNGYLEKGGMIRLRLVDDEIHFEVNLRPASQAGLRISARLLQLATRVQGTER